MTGVNDILKMHTPQGGYGSVMPAPVLGGVVIYWQTKRQTCEPPGKLLMHFQTATDCLNPLLFGNI